MLIVSRKEGERIEISLQETAGQNVLEQVFARGVIGSRFTKLSANRGKIAIDAPAELEIHRGESGRPVAESEESPRGESRIGILGR